MHQYFIKYAIVPYSLVEQFADTFDLLNKDEIVIITLKCKLGIPVCFFNSF